VTTTNTFPPIRPVTYVYRARITRVVDGDTVDADIDLGFGVTTHQRLRLLGINAPETRGETRDAGDAATEHLTEMLALGPVTVQTVKDKRGKFGRYLAVVQVETLSGVISANAELVTNGHAVEYWP